MVAECKRPVHVTRHAVERAMLRLGCATAVAARKHLQQAWSGSISIPERYARQLCKADRGKPHKGRRVQWRVAGSTLMVCRGARIITTWKLDDNQAATVLWFCTANCWALT